MGDKDTPLDWSKPVVQDEDGKPMGSEHEAAPKDAPKVEEPKAGKK